MPPNDRVLLCVGEPPCERDRVATILAEIADVQGLSAQAAIRRASDPRVVGAILRFEPGDRATPALLVELRARRPTLPMLGCAASPLALPLNLLAELRVPACTSPVEPGVLGALVRELRAFAARSRFEHLLECIVRTGLSAREREVAILLAAGFTQREVAAELGVAPTTIKTHVRSILNKTGAPSARRLVSGRGS